jgi:hypothetical protein
MMRILITLLALVAVNAASAQSALIKNATVHTATSAGSLEQTDILIQDGKVHRLGRNLDAPDSIPVFDAAGRSVTPGLFGGITVLGIAEISLEAASVDNSVVFTEFRPDFNVMPAYNPNSSHVAIQRVEGITQALIAPQASGSIVAGTGNVITLDGSYDAAISSGVLFIDIGGDSSKVSGGSRAAQYMLLQQALDEAGARKEINGRFRLLTERGRTTLNGFTNGSKNVVFEVDRASDILQVLKFAGNHGMKAVIQGGTEAWMVAEHLAAANVAVMLNPLDNLPANFDSLGATIENAARLHDAGVTVIFTLRGGVNSGARKVRQIAGNAVAYGLPWHAALAALTSNPARVFGYSDRLGSIEPGKQADLVIWSGDPLEVTSFADQVFMGGEAISMESRQTKLRDRYLPENPGKPRAYIKP